MTIVRINGSSRTRLNYYCDAAISREGADIEGSKSNVAMNAWLPQASYPCGNFSDTSSFNSEDVPPQPNSPPDNVFRPESTGRSRSWVQKEGLLPRFRFTE
ncbi:hypothetical protein V6N13_082720 [Hibiscus sabdariffa]